MRSHGRIPVSVLSRERGRPTRYVGGFACFPKRAGHPRSQQERVKSRKRGCTPFTQIRAEAHNMPNERSRCRYDRSFLHPRRLQNPWKRRESGFRPETFPEPRTLRLHKPEVLQAPRPINCTLAYYGVNRRRLAANVLIPAVNKSTRDAFNSTQDCQQMAIVPHRRASERKRTR